MSYTETANQEIASSDVNWNDGTGDITAAIFEVGGIHKEIYAVGAFFKTAYVGMTTSQVIQLDILAGDRVTRTAAVETITLTSNVVGAVVVNRMALSGPTRAPAGGQVILKIKTAGVGTSGTCRPFIIWKNMPFGDPSNLTVVTA